MIESFKHKGLKRLFEDGDRKLIQPELAERISTVLAYLDAAKAVEELNLPSLRLHPLKGDFKGFWSITVRANWRIIFRFEDGAVLDVELIDYH
ncbi:type II toxin-antitoxin system RelE/ParE family toxin [Rhodoblastus sp.]|uniref:type II toxin-antitoxin system RelE/ParE family toxin n=1 Tax=Rhodoblastus sp. TaxID=1962975 RepID=UPI003F9B3846